MQCHSAAILRRQKKIQAVADLRCCLNHQITIPRAKFTQLNYKTIHLVKKKQYKFEKKGIIMLPFSSVVFLRSSASMCTSCRMRGRRVTMPVPRGRMSLPTRLSKTELFPLLCRKKKDHQCHKQKHRWWLKHE